MVQHYNTLILNPTLWMLLALLTPLSAWAQEQEDSVRGGDLREVRVGAMRTGLHDGSIQSREVIGKGDLIRAACCNLGESFTNSASVDVSYADPTTGVRQVKLLGLSGTYVQMMTENIPTFRGLSQPYALTFVPGPWMSSIQVSKGASSVKNGYESMTGQINIEYLKPQSTDALHVNAYLNNKLAYEWNVDGNKHLGKSGRWSGGFLLHGDRNIIQRDMNGDGFRDEPTGHQWNAMLRLAYVSPRYIMQMRGSAILDSKTGGQKEKRYWQDASEGPMGWHHEAGKYVIDTDNHRLDLHLKNAYIFNPEKDGNVALILSGERQRLDMAGTMSPDYEVLQNNMYASLLFEEQFTPSHGLSAGLSLQRDNFADEHVFTGGSYSAMEQVQDMTPRETVAGVYAQYTYTLDDKLTLMAGLRADRSSLYGAFVTPRAHLRWHPTEWFTVRASAGKGYRTPHLYPEMHHLMANNRKWVQLGDKLPQEESWNTGTSMQFAVPLFGRNLELNVDYYYTRFMQQLVVDRDADAHKILFYGLPEGGKSFSHCLQLDATYPVFQGFELTAAWRLNHVRTTYLDGRLRELPLTNRWKGLVTATYKTPLELWQLDVTCQVNGPGRMPEPYVIHNSQLTIDNWLVGGNSPVGESSLSWDKEYKAFPQLSAQVTRFFRWGSLYAGGENLTNYHLKHPIIEAGNPQSPDFDSNMIWGPVHGAMGYVGVRFNLEKY